MSKDYKDTLLLPRTDFPMKADLAKREPHMVEQWDESRCYHKMQEKNAGRQTFILHDGPPYANGNIHIGTAFNKILKDFFPKYMTMKGYLSPYVPGWDTHGLPIELKVLKESGADKDDMDPVELRRRCKEYALQFLDVQRGEFKRLGVLGDWENPYITLVPEYEAAQLEVFAHMVDKGLVYKGQKPVFWCTDCQTALAAAEIEYENDTSQSLFVTYPLNTEKFPELGEAYVAIWTTTPWTLPASCAVALHPDYDYGFYRTSDGRVILMSCELSKSVAQSCGVELTELILSVKGARLEGVQATHPFYDDKKLPLVMADYVMLDSGSGCVHTAPGHGVEDFETGVRYGIPIYNPVDSRGFFLPATPLVGGKDLDEGGKLVMAALKERGHLLGVTKITHSYPHCWRCRKPVIFRATAQWFVSVKDFKEASLEAIQGVRWTPAWGEDRITNMVRDRSDWCISRQRVWGVPIPAFHCTKCGDLVLSGESVRRVASHVKKGGGDIWWQMTPQELLGDMCVCPKCGSHDIEKESDIMDVWFDSGCSHAAVLTTRPELAWPADLYLEGSDQHRGWFQTSLLTSVATKGTAPYKSVLTHGFVMDGQGRKMSKSLGNVTAPSEIINKYGADILRLWAASADYRNDVRISETILKNLSESYRRIRNSARFLLGNLVGFNPKVHAVPRDKMHGVDRWLLFKVQELVKKATRGYDDREFHVPTFLTHQFCDNELSSFYMDVNKDRLYADGEDSVSRRSAQTVMWETLSVLCRILAPVLSFTTEEIWQHMREFDRSLPESVFLAPWPEYDVTGLDEASMPEWGRLLEARGAVLRALEGARTGGLIGKSLEARVRVNLGEKYASLAETFGTEIWELATLVSDFEATQDALPGTDGDTGISVDVQKCTYEKCPRCWKHKPEVAQAGLCHRCAEAVKETA